jgi:uncharacterized SAM-binding protein YcdF (DUF218 family)
MMTKTAIGIGILVAVPTVIVLRYYQLGRKVALRDPLRKADAIVAVAGTRGDIQYLEAKVRTAVRLYKDGWAPIIIFSGRFSRKVNGSPRLIPVSELRAAAAAGRIRDTDVPTAAETWDEALGANYMHDLAIQLGVPSEAIILEEQSLHTHENAMFTADILRNRRAKRFILVSTPFHQRRTYESFLRALGPYRADIVNYYASTPKWSPLTWYISGEHRKLVAAELSRIAAYGLGGAKANH